MQLMCAAMGVWTAYLLCVLYNEYNAQKQAAGIKENGRITQYHEVTLADFLKSSACFSQQECWAQDTEMHFALTAKPL